MRVGRPRARASEPCRCATRSPGRRPLQRVTNNARPTHGQRASRPGPQEPPPDLYRPVRLGPFAFLSLVSFVGSSRKEVQTYHHIFCAYHLFIFNYKLFSQFKPCYLIFFFSYLTVIVT